MTSISLPSVKEVRIGPVTLGGRRPLALIAGPCVIESEGACLEVAAWLKELTRSLGIPLIFKSSYDKANRSSLRSYRGPGLDRGLKVLDRVKRELEIPVLSDVHRLEEVKEAAQVLDVLQVPAFLCRQTDFVLAVAQAGKGVNVKKGQFLAPWDVQNIVEKIESADPAHREGGLLRLQQPGGGHEVLGCYAADRLPGDIRRNPQPSASRGLGNLIGGTTGIHSSSGQSRGGRGDRWAIHGGSSQPFGSTLRRAQLPAFEGSGPPPGTVDGSG
jgi:hypothetical protein